MRVQAQLRAQRLASGKKAKDKAKNAMRKATTSAIYEVRALDHALNESLRISLDKNFNEPNKRQRGKTCPSLARLIRNLLSKQNLIKRAAEHNGAITYSPIEIITLGCIMLYVRRLCKVHHEHPISLARVRSCQDLFAGQMAKPTCQISEWSGGCLQFKDLPQTHGLTSPRWCTIHQGSVH